MQQAGALPLQGAIRLAVLQASVFNATLETLYWEKCKCQMYYA
jgi:hypothetical protein